MTSIDHTARAMIENLKCRIDELEHKSDEHYHEDDKNTEGETNWPVFYEAHTHDDEGNAVF